MIRSPIRKLKIRHFFNFSSPSSPPPRWSNWGKRLLSSQFVQVPDTPTNFHRPSTSRSTELAKVLGQSFTSNSPKESGSMVHLCQSSIQNLCLFFPIKLHFDLSTLTVFRFPRFPFPSSTAPMYTNLRNGATKT